jgi:hypothetical protein
MPSGKSSGVNNVPAAAEWKPQGMVPVTNKSPRASSLAPSKRLLKKAKIDTAKATLTSIDQEDSEETAMGTSERKYSSSSPRDTDDSQSPSPLEKRTIVYPAESIHFCKLPSLSTNSAKGSSLTEGIDPDVSAALKT